MSTPATYETILVEYAEGIATITLNRPDSLNALNLTVLEDVTAAAADADADDSVRAIILTGAGKAFAAGADIKQMASLDFATAYRKNWFAGWSRLSDVSKPIIAAVNGFALGGGCELAMACDIRIASNRARFGLPEATLGVLPGAGGTQRLARLVGTGRAVEMILTGRFVDADEALGIGLVTSVVTPDALLDSARETAATIAAKGPLAVRLAKLVVRAGMDADQGTGQVVERLAQAVLYGSADKTEGATAFLDKRTPAFQGR